MPRLHPEVEKVRNVSLPNVSIGEARLIVNALRAGYKDGNII